MKYIDHVESVWQQYFKETFDVLELKKYEVLDNGMGALIKFKNNFFEVQLLDDRATLTEFGFSPLGENTFIGVEILNSYLKIKESTHTLDRNERQSILTKRLDYYEQALFLKNNFTKLIEILSKKEFKETIANEINEVSKERFTLYFPNAIQT